MNESPTVFLVDDNKGVREATRFLVESVGLTVEAYPSAIDFLDHYDPTRPGCLVLDIRMPRMSGLELQEVLREQNASIPIIFMTGHGDVTLCVRAYEGGAFAFVEKPVNHQVLLDHIQRAIADDQHQRQLRANRPDIAARLQRLTPREREVMDLLVAARSMKQISSQLEISVQTASKHRARVLEKMEVENDVELVRLVLVGQTS